MAGYREFRQGEVWFYYNPNVSKELERKRELGAITSRPVVIIQDAYYPEWNDTIAVVPITSSDRRSGVHIDTTILSDGCLLEGGTALPYCIFTVKTKFLHAMTSTSRGDKYHLVSLSDQDWQAVYNGVLYHLGVSKVVPEYVENWKQLDDYERNIILRNAHIAVEDFEKHVFHYPRLIQTPTDTNYVENHVLQACDTLDPSHSTIDMSGKTQVDVTTAETKEVREARKDESFKKVCMFKELTTDEFLEFLDDNLGGALPANKDSARLYPGSLILAEVAYNQIDTVLDPAEISQICNMTINEIMEMSGAKSKTTASRIRKYAREIAPDAIETVDGTRYVQPFIYIYPGSVNRSRLKRSARRRKVLFSYPQEELLKMIPMDITELQEIIPELSSSSLKQLKMDIGYMYPEATVEYDGEETTLSNIQNDLETKALEAVDTELSTTYELWETLSKGEIAEVASASKRNSRAIAKKYGLSQGQFTNLKNIAIELSRKNSNRFQPKYDVSRTKIAIMNVIRDTKLKEVSYHDMLIYCRSEHTVIMECYGEVKSPNTPSKGDIASIKRAIRRFIVKRNVK